MPELPEVETMRRGVEPVVGSRVLGLRVVRSRYRPLRIEPASSVFGRRVRGRQIVAAERIGKRVVLRLDSGRRIVFEPRMTGLVLTADPPSREHLRFCLKLDGQIGEVWYWDRRGLGSVTLWDEVAFRAHFCEPRLGPDALEMDAAAWRARLGPSGRPIKVALLDQARVAGIGNLYASEILHLARISPQTPCNRLTGRHWQRLDRAAREVLKAAIRYEGSTLGDGTYRNALNQEGSYQNHHRVYDREGAPCPVCREAVVRTVQAQRSTFFCPKCQSPT